MPPFRLAGTGAGTARPRSFRLARVCRPQSTSFILIYERVSALRPTPGMSHKRGHCERRNLAAGLIVPRASRPLGRGHPARAICSRHFLRQFPGTIRQRHSLAHIRARQPLRAGRSQASGRDARGTTGCIRKSRLREVAPSRHLSRPAGRAVPMSSTTSTNVQLRLGPR